MKTRSYIYFLLLQQYKFVPFEKEKKINLKKWRGTSTYSGSLQMTEWSFFTLFLFPRSFNTILSLIGATYFLSEAVWGGNVSWTMTTLCGWRNSSRSKMTSITISTMIIHSRVEAWKFRHLFKIFQLDRTMIFVYPSFMLRFYSLREKEEQRCKILFFLISINWLLWKNKQIIILKNQHVWAPACCPPFWPTLHSNRFESSKN